MPNSLPSSVSVIRRSVLALLPLLSLGLHGIASAQTAPQLLPYTAKLIAGGGTAKIAANATCPVSGYTSSDAFGNGCLATEIEIGNTASGGTTPGARGAVADANGNVFFTDYNNALVRRVDAGTGIVTVVAGGGTAAAGTSSNALGTAVKLSHPAGIAFAPNGDLYFTDPGNGQVFKIASTNGLIATTGIISLVAGNASGTYGYAAGNATTTVTAANSYLRAVYGLAFDSKGDLFMTDEYYYAILALNTNATGTNVVNNVSLPAGQIWKIAGTSTGATAPYCINGTTSSSGCSDALYTSGIQANSDLIRGVYSVAVDPNGNVYSGEEYYDSVFKVSNVGSSAGVLTTFAGVPNAPAKVLKRGPAGSFGIGSAFGIAADANGNVYFTDASSGVIWRVDGAGQSQYVVAGGATTICAAATDTYGDGCPALQAKFGSSSGTGNFATATLPGPGLYGISADANSDLFFGDTETNLVREVASGTQFGVIGANQPTDILDIHFGISDAPAGTGAYTLTSGATNFSLGTASCTLNSDSTTDCLLPVTATPSVLGLFTGTLTVTSQLGATANFALSGTYAQSPLTRTVIGFTANSVTCTGTTIYATTTPITFTATLVANGPAPPTGTISFYANGTLIGTAQNVTNIGTTTTPVYGATLTNTFATPNQYTITASYSGNSYFKTSNSTPTSVTSSAPSFTAAATSYTNTSSCVLSGKTYTPCISPGQTGLYSFTLTQNVYSGTIAMSCSGLPANSSCSFSPITITANGCSTTSTVSLSILTQQGAVSSSLGFGGGGVYSVLSMMGGFGLALLIGLRRRQTPMRFGQIAMVLALLVGASGLAACGSSVQTAAPTPAGSYTVIVNATGSTGATSTFTVPLNVN